MSMVNEVFKLFEGANMAPAIVLAALAFVLGLVSTCILCKVLHPCGSKACAVSDKKHKKDDRPFEKRKPHPAPSDGSVEIYVGNLSYDMTEDDLRKEFEAYGKVNLARLITNRSNGKSKGFGFVQMPDRAEADRAVAALNDKDIMGRKMKCNEAKNLI